MYQNATNWRPELSFEKSLLQPVGWCTWLTSTVTSMASRSKACGLAGSRGWSALLLGNLAGPFLVLVHFCTHCARVRRLPGSPGGLATRPPCWRVFRRQTPACLKPGSSCPRALRAEAAGPRFCPFLSHNSCPVSHLSLPTPSACALGNIRVLCVLESLALRMLKSSPITSVPLPVCTGSSGCLPSPIV